MKDMPSEGRENSSVLMTLAAWVSGPNMHRICLCGLSLMLLWATTLRVAIGIVGLVFSSPEFSRVHNACTFAYEQISDQRTRYEDCVYREMLVCDRELLQSYEREKTRSTKYLNRNQEAVDALKYANQNCSLSLGGSSSALREWASAGANDPIAYLPACTGEQLQQVQNQLNDASEIWSGGVADLLAYVQETESALQGVAAYSSALGRYNSVYIENKTEALAQSANLVKVDADAIAIAAEAKLSATLAALSASADHLIDCIGLSNASSTAARATCSAGKGVYDVYHDMEYLMKSQKSFIDNKLNNFKITLDSYIADIAAARKIADNFYDSIAGGKGLLKYLISDLSLFRSSSELCGRTTPDWCTFSKVCIYLYYIYLYILYYLHRHCVCHCATVLG
jgi:hypothetical protein